MNWFSKWKKEGRASLDKYILSIDLGTPFFENSIVRILLLLALFPLMASIVILGSTIFPLEIPIILRYNVYFGVSLLGDWWQVYIFPFVGIFIYGIHILLAKHYYHLKERVASYLVLLSSIFLALGIMIVTLSLAIVNF